MGLPGALILPAPYRPTDPSERTRIYFLKMPYEVHAIKFYLTYPKCYLTKEEVRAEFERKWPDDEIEWTVIGEELHQDGTPHIHAAIRFRAKKHYRTHTWADIIGGVVGRSGNPRLKTYHGNYVVMKYVSKCVTYVIKCGSYASVGVDPETLIAKRGNSFSICAEAIRNGATMRTLFNEMPGFVMNHKRKIDDFLNLTKRIALEDQAIEWDGCIVGAGSPQATYEIAAWLTRNLRQERPFKMKQLWIWGPHDMGKTSLAIWLATQVRVYDLPNDEAFYDMWDDECYDLVIIDEFKGQKKITWLNQFVQGSNMSIAQKGSQSTKRVNVPVIVLSNFRPADCYYNSGIDHILTIYARFDVVHVTEFIRIHGI